MLDNLVGGGISAGQSVAETVVKEAFEEAGIDASLAARARPAGTVDICRAQPDGLQRETIFVHDLWLPADFTPVCIDGEAVLHRLVELPEAARLIGNADGRDVATADSSLVILDCLLRHGAIPTAAARLRGARCAAPPVPARRMPRLDGALRRGARAATAGLTWRIPISDSVSRTALTAWRISVGADRADAADAERLDLRELARDTG